MIYQKSKAKRIVANKVEINAITREAIKIMADSVGATLGPGGRPVVIERDGLSPLITKDGVTVAKDLGVEDAASNVIMEAAKEICLNTAKQAGDGTTTAIVLASAITEFGTEFLHNNPKYNPQRMVNELQDAYKNVIVPFLSSNSRKVKNNEELVYVANISANGDMKIAEAAVKAVLSAGEDGHVIIEEAQGDQIKVETMDGFIVTSGLKDIGAVGRAFINDRVNQQVKMDNGIVFLYDGTMNDLKAPAAIQRAVENSDLFGRPIVVFAHGFADVVVSKFAESTQSGYTVVPVKTPMSGFANSRSMFLLDMGAYTSATVYNPGNLDDLLEKEGVNGFGEFVSGKVGMYESVITGQPEADKLDARIAELKHIMEISPSDWDRMHLKAAIGKLVGGISTIWVGGESELEAREKKARVEDAVEAVKSAIAEGIIPGGCVVHMRLQELLTNSENTKPSWSILIKALDAPFNLLMHNCGEDPESVRNALYQSETWKSTGLPNVVFDASLHVISDPFSTGIIEPAKVCRVSLGNALSVASLLITLGGIVVVPRDANMENQLAASKSMFKEMMSGGGVGQE